MSVSSPGTEDCFLTSKSSTFKLLESACRMMKQQGIHGRTLALPALNLPLEAALDQCQPAVKVVGGNDPTVCVCVSSHGSSGVQEVVNPTPSSMAV